MSVPAAVSLQGQRFTVVGGDGFVGRALVQTLRVRGAQVWQPGRRQAPPWPEPLGHVMYCAGLTADYLARPTDTVQAHACLLAQVLQQPRWDSLVYLSSTRLYDALGVTVAHEDVVLPLNPANPRHLYDLSKALGESLCHVMGRGRARVARLACVYDGPEDVDGFLPQLWRQVATARRQNRQEVAVASSPHSERDYVHLPDVVQALIGIALHGQQPVYNVASGANVSNTDLFAWLQRRWGCRIAPQQSTAAAPAPRISIARLQGELQWQPQGVLEVMGRWPEDESC